ncbi:CRISPR system precrRNA processing endoribonuclease RAMP protein Cas6 [Paludibaculum fermentans]|uniref:CRISPR system precrRNA processing endoribonuclease RAMP protein Cas6 n=1 Tax=Paludibaculum fermentans TaxID=1473598 RepID=A0A7S7SMM1_PALFE|nr:CRISPR system precrRNA processing endoribonuclease RAMP protein Cas6 [Paludibaculum fermentans]
MAAGVDLDILACRLSLCARRFLRFPTPASNRFRGALGFQLPEELFRPSATQGPSGLRDRPRPFTLRCHHLDGAAFEPGARFFLDLHLFTRDPAPFQNAFERLEWLEVIEWNTASHRLSLIPEDDKQHLSFSGFPSGSDKRQVLFITPTELKPHAGPEPPPFAILLARACERISALRSFYGAGPLDFDFRELVREAAAVRCTGGALSWHQAERRSGRSGQVHPLGGFTGFAEYEGALRPFLPWLEAATWTGIGRQTVWGKGVMELSCPAGPALSTEPHPLGPSGSGPDPR